MFGKSQNLTKAHEFLESNGSEPTVSDDGGDQIESN